MGTKVDYPIRAIDFDAENSILYTGDEMGYIQRWDISILLAKLEEVSRKERKVPYKGPSDILEDGLGILESSSKKNLHESATFVTGIDAGGTAPKAKIEFVQGHIKMIGRTSNQEKNPLWKIQNENETTIIIMYCEVDTLCILCPTSYQKILDYEKTNNKGNKITWYKTSNGYISCHLNVDNFFWITFIG